MEENCDKIYLIEKQNQLRQACSEYLKSAENDEVLYVGYDEAKCNEQIYGYECFHAIRNENQEDNNLINKYNINLVWPNI